jgi:hypothetical protein
MMHRQGNGEFLTNINFGEHDVESVVGVIDIYIVISLHMPTNSTCTPRETNPSMFPQTTCNTRELFKGTISSKA